MTTDEKKACMLLKSVIFHYHGLDKEEMLNLQTTADELEAHDELAWANSFISEDYFNSFERAREYLNVLVKDFPLKKRIELIKMVWEANQLKGYVTEFEAASIIKIAKDWKIENALLRLIEEERKE
jgi:uncharacterized tellurite resistance protein B-like protein